MILTWDILCGGPASFFMGCRQKKIIQQLPGPLAVVTANAAQWGMPHCFHTGQLLLPVPQPLHFSFLSLPFVFGFKRYGNKKTDEFPHPFTPLTQGIYHSQKTYLLLAKTKLRFNKVVVIIRA